jgi:hypothetical protein
LFFYLIITDTTSKMSDKTGSPIAAKAASPAKKTELTAREVEVLAAAWVSLKTEADVSHPETCAHRISIALVLVIANIPTQWRCFAQVLGCFPSPSAIFVASFPSSRL